MEGDLEQKISRDYEPAGKKKMSFGKKVAVGTGLVVGGTIVGAGAIAHKIWRFVYPPSLKKYVSIGMSVGFLYTILNFGTCTRGFKHVAEKHVIPYMHIVGQQKKKIDALENKNKADQRIIDDLKSLKSAEDKRYQAEFDKKYQLLEEQMKTYIKSNSQVSPTSTQLARPQVQAPRTHPPTPLAKEPVYFVQEKGTNLVKIAKEITGDADNWEFLAQYNDKEIEHTRNGKRVLICIGELLRVPREMLSNQRGVRYLAVVQGPHPDSEGIVSKEYYQLSPGEDVYSAVGRVTGDTGNWRAVFDYNRRLMPSFNPDMVEHLRFPSGLVRNRKLLVSD